MQELTKPTKERNRPKQADRQAERSKADRKKWLENGLKMASEM